MANNINANFDWRKWAFNGLLNFKNWLDAHSQVLKSKIVTPDGVSKILSVIIKNLDEFMKLGDNFEVRLNKSKNGEDHWFTFGETDSRKEEYIVCGSGGITYDDKGNDMENVQQLGWAEGNNVDDAAKNFLKENFGVLMFGKSFKDVCFYKVGSSEEYYDLEYGRFNIDGKIHINVKEELEIFKYNQYGESDYLADMKNTLKALVGEIEQDEYVPCLEISYEGLEGEERERISAAFDVMISECKIPRKYYNIIK